MGADQYGEIAQAALAHPTRERVQYCKGNADEQRGSPHSEIGRREAAIGPHDR